jgi:hypothetical protein
MNPSLFSQAETFVWGNARLIDRHLFSALLCGGPTEPVIDTLKAYQNSDGGFGQALEPDNRCPESQPIFVETALVILDKINALSEPRVRTELLLPVCDYLTSITTNEGGVPFVLPSANPYPHTPWMGAPDNPPASLNPTASIAGLLLKAGIQHPWLEQAAAYCWKEIATSQAEAFHDILPMVTFLENAGHNEKAAAELERIAASVRSKHQVELDPEAGGYVKMPLDWAPRPASFFRKLFDDEVIRLHLAALASRQQADGGWPITWDTVSPAAAAEWRGRVTIDALVTLRAYEGEGIAVGLART